MRIIISKGGLGNVMFQYALVIVFRSGIRTKDKSAVLFVSDTNMTDHNGYELNKVFPNTQEIDDNISIFQRIYLVLCRSIRRIRLSHKHFFPHKVLFFPRKTYYENRNSEDLVFSPTMKHGVYNGLYQNYSYFKGCEDNIRKSFNFNVNLLSLKTKEMSCRMEQCNSISLHVRRTDYLNDFYSQWFSNVCTDEYYSKAVEYMCGKVANVFFFIFSDDKEYVKQKFNHPNMTIVDFNNGTDSWQDMYLMSKCKHNIIANSTFSWWGAWLNNHPQKIVVAPKLWFTESANEKLIPNNWIRL